MQGSQHNQSKVRRHTRRHPKTPGKIISVKQHWRKMWPRTNPATKATVVGGGEMDKQFQTGYFRPGEGMTHLAQAPKEVLEGLGGQIEQLGRTTYTVTFFDKTEGRWMTAVGLRTGTVKGKPWTYFRVPTDKHGRVPEGLAAERLFDVLDGSRTGGHRNPLVDFAVTANVRSSLISKKGKNRLETYRWWIYPNESDVKGLDVAESEIKELLPKSKGNKRKRHIVISGGTKEHRLAVASAVSNGFTVKEKRILAGTLIKIGPTPPQVAGYYRQLRDAYGKPLGAPLIVISPRFANERDLVAVHECIHMLREHDTSRKGALKHTKTYQGRDKDLEESMTEAETRSRQKPFIPGRGAGYYQYVQGRGSKSDAKLETEDRIVINTIDLEKHKLETRNKRGKRAQSAVRKNFPKTNLARVKIEGDAEAVDSFYTAEREDGVKVNIHTRQMKGGKAADQIEQKVLKKEFARVSEWRDGRKVRLK